MIRTKLQILTLCLLVLPFTMAQAADEKATVCAGDSLLWRCQLLGETGTYYDGPSNTMQLRVVTPVTNNSSLTICEGDTLLWRCKLLYEEGDYYDTIKSLVCSTCDSIRYKLTLSFSSPTPHPESATIFMDDTLLWRCKQIIGEAEGQFEYRDTVLSPLGCPQDVFILTLTVLPVDVELVETSYTSCGNDTVLWRCQLLTESGVYHDTLQSFLHVGYDSVYYTFNLTMREQTIAEWDTIYVKSSEFPYDWNGWVSCPTADEYTYWEKYPKTPDQIAQGLDACDSLLHRVRIIQRDTTEMTSCNGDTVLWRCTQAYETKVYSESVLGVGVVSGEEYTKELYYLDFTFHDPAIDSLKNDTVTAIPYQWRTLSIEESGTYRDTVFSVPNDRSSCIDSLFTLNLKVELAKDSLEEFLLCGGDTLLWRCQLVYESGEYNDVLKYEPSGNDSIRFTLNLTIAKDSVAPVEVKYLEPEQSLTWWDADGNLVEYTEPGEHSYLSKYENGCDSVLHRLQIVRYDSTSLKSCDGDTILWRCHVASETKIYRDTVREASIFGGEYDKELYILNFTFHQAPYDSIKADTISSLALPYVWRTGELTESGEYRDTTYVDNDPTNCIDSLFTLNLLVQQVTDSLVYDTLCQGDTLLWRCKQVFATGLYYDTIFYENSGNDSIRFTLDLTIHKDSIAPLQQEILCNNDSLLWFDGTWIKETGHYQCQSKYAPTLYQEALGQEGCDSVYHELIVVARHVRDSVVTDTICKSGVEGYSWRGLTPDIPDGDLQTKTYYLYDTVRYVGSTECDSLRLKLELTVQRPTLMAALDTTVCKSDVINFTWKPYNTEYSGFTVTTTKFDTARYSITGCDSVIYQLNLRVLEPLVDTLVTDTTLCPTDALEWFGQTYSTAGRYEHTVFYTGTECDSVYCRLQLHYYAAPDTIADAITICEGAQPYLWHEKNITSEGIYWDSTYYDGTQCINHFFKLEVSMLSPKTQDTTAMFCQGGSFLWDRSGEQLTDTGTYEYKIPYQVLAGCDSLIIRLHLGVIVPKEMPVETAYICDGQSYTWRGNTYSATGVYMDTVLSVSTGCDSLYYALNLERQPAMQTLNETMYICNGESVTWSFNQQTYTHAGIYDHTIPSVHGCDSIAGRLYVYERTTKVEEPENVSIYATQSYQWINGVTYTEAGSYEYAVPHLDGNCDSILYTLNLTVLDINYAIKDVSAIVCPGVTYKNHAIEGHTQWSDTVRATDPTGALVDSIYNYDIDVYEFTMPEGFMGFVVASCGMPVNVDSALTLLQKHIDSFDNFAGDASITWKYREGNSSTWKDLDGTTALDGQTENVTVRCELATDCGIKTQEQTYEVGKRATPETFTEYDLLPVIVKYNGQMLMVDVDAICAKFGWTNGVEIKPEDVQWYQRVGAVDNLSYPDPSDPRDIPTNKWGYYYVPSDDLDYYAIIKGKLEVQEEDCGVWARTLVVEGSSPIQLNPNVTQGGASVSVQGTTQCYVTVSDMYGNIVMARKAVTGSFNAPAAAGTYFVQIEDGVSVAHRTLIVY